MTVQHTAAGTARLTQPWHDQKRSWCQALQAGKLDVCSVSQGGAGCASLPWAKNFQPYRLNTRDFQNNEFLILLRHSNTCPCVISSDPCPAISPSRTSGDSVRREPA